MATYNGQKYIKEQITSILEQLGDNDELVISDDQSTDNTLDIIHSFHDERIKVFVKPEKVTTDFPLDSATHNFANALAHSKGDLIFLADQDDVWKPNKVEVCMKWLQKYYCVVSDAEVTDSSLNTLFPSLYRLLGVRQGKLYNTLWKNGYTGCCMAFRRNVLEVSLPFPKNIPMHDIWIGNVAAYKYNVKFISDKLIFFRRHKDTISCNGKGSKFSWWQQLLFRINTIKNLIKL